MTPAFALLFAACNRAAPTAVPTPAPTSAPPVVAHEHAEGPDHHFHAGPHNGIVRTVGDLHVEALFMASGVMFYVSDKDENPLPVDGMTGQVTLQSPSGAATVDLMPMADHLHAPATLGEGQAASAVLTLTRDGKTIGSSSFETASVGLQSHDHTALHGGQVGMWGDYHVEYVGKDGEYQVWVTDATRNPITGAISGAVKTGDTAVALTSDGPGTLVAKADGAGTKDVTVELTIDGQQLKLPFTANGDEPEHQH